MVETDTESWEPSGRLDDRVVSVLAVQDGHLAFNGLRRRLGGVHPESLSRALRRLERDGAVVRAAGAYSLAEPVQREANRPRREAHLLATVGLPDGVTRETVFGAVAGRWFGQLRWVGVYERATDPWLVWTVEGEGGEVALSLRRGALRVLVDPDDARLKVAGRELLRAVLERLRPSYEGEGRAGPAGN